MDVTIHAHKAILKELNEDISPILKEWNKDISTCIIYEI